jgi:hypothetical protein
MKFVEPSRLTDPVAAARKPVDIANGIEPAQDGAAAFAIPSTAYYLGAGSPDPFSEALSCTDQFPAAALRRSTLLSRR